MSNEEKISCWACDTQIPKESKICPNCDMPLTDDTDETEDIDALLDNLSNDSTGEISELPEIPSFDDDLPEIPTIEESTDLANVELPSVPEFEADLPEIPDVDFKRKDHENEELEIMTEPRIPDIDYQVETIDIETNDSELVEEFPKIPDFDESQFEEEEEKEQFDIVQSEDLLLLSDLSLKDMSRIFFPQFLYWSIVFVVISFIGIEVENSNFNLETFNSDYYSIRAELFLFGWLTFLPMGWFVRYKLNQYQVEAKLKYGLLFLILLFIFISLVTITLFLVVNPSAELTSLSDTDTTITTILTTYVYFIWLSYLISGFTLGFLLFFVGYKYYYDQIYSNAPISDLTN